MNIRPVQLGGPAVTDKYISKLVKNNEIGNAAFRLAYLALYEMGCWGHSLDEICEFFGWSTNLAKDVVEEVAALGLITIHEN